MIFNWSLSRLARLRSAVRSYNRAITMRERELREEGRDDIVDMLPSRVTVESIKAEIKNVNDFRRIVGYRGDLKRGRSSRLTRILKTYNPDALEFAEDSSLTNYDQREYRNDQIALTRMRNRRRRALQEDLFEGDALTKDLTNMDKTEYANAVDKTDLVGDDEGEHDRSVEDLPRDTYERWNAEDARIKRDDYDDNVELERYIKEWSDPLNGHQYMEGYHDMLDALEWMRDERPDVGMKLMDSGADEIEPVYLIDSDRQAGMYRNIPIEERNARARKFVMGYARRAGWRSYSTMLYDELGRYGMTEEEAEAMVANLRKEGAVGRSEVEALIRDLKGLMR